MVRALVGGTFDGDKRDADIDLAGRGGALKMSPISVAGGDELHEVVSIQHLHTPQRQPLRLGSERNRPSARNSLKAVFHFVSALWVQAARRRSVDRHRGRDWRGPK